MKKHLLTALFLLVAIVLYAIGAAVHATLLILLGCVAEVAFWLRVTRSSKKTPET